MAVSIAVVESSDRQLTMLARGAGLIVSGSVPIGELAGLDRQGKPPDVLLVDLRGRTTLPTDLANLKRRHPRMGVVIVASQLDPAMMLEAMRAGVNEFVTEPIAGRRSQGGGRSRRRPARRRPPRPDRFSRSSAPRAASARRRWRSTSRRRSPRERAPSVLMADLHVTAHGDAALLLRRRAAVLGR